MLLVETGIKLFKSRRFPILASANQVSLKKETTNYTRGAPKIINLTNNYRTTHCVVFFGKVPRIFLVRARNILNFCGSLPETMATMGRFPI